MKVNKNILKRICRVAREVAARYRDNGLEVFRGEAEMEDMYRGDYKDLCKVADLAESGKFSQAADHARYMDTAARDEIPDDLYNLIEALDLLEDGNEDEREDLESTIRNITKRYQDAEDYIETEVERRVKKRLQLKKRLQNT